MENKLTAKDVLNQVSKNYKQADFDYAIKNILPSYLKIIVIESIHKYSDIQNDSQYKRIEELEAENEKLKIQISGKTFFDKEEVLVTQIKDLEEHNQLIRNDYNTLNAKLSIAVEALERIGEANEFELMPESAIAIEALSKLQQD